MKREGAPLQVRVVILTEDSPTREERPRSARVIDTLGGMFGPVRNFAARLADRVPVSTMVLTGSGLVEAEASTPPYEPVRSLAEAARVAKTHRVPHRVASALRSGDVLIVALSGPYLGMVHHPGEGISLLAELPPTVTVFVAAPMSHYKSLEREAARGGTKLFFFPRLGVVRLTASMQRTIEQFILTGEEPQRPEVR